MTFIDLIPAGLLQGLLLACVSLGVMIPFRILNAPDLTAEGSYPLAGALSASLLLAGLSPWISLICAVMVSGCAGLATAFLHLRFKADTLLAGIILSTMIYGINLRLMGRPNLSFYGNETLLHGSMAFQITVLLVLNLALFGLLYRFFMSEKGLRMRAVGLNPSLARKQGVSLNAYIYLGFFLGNALAGLGGSLMIQTQSYADVGMGVGIAIHALAAIMIGEALLGTHHLWRCLCAPLIGALVYQQIQGFVISLGVAPSDLKIMTGLIVISTIALRRRHASI